MSLARRFAQGSAWMMAGTGADNLIQFIIFAFLARILTIREFGIVAFALLFIDLSRILVTGGLPQSLIQRESWNDRVSSVCFTYNAVMALIVAILFGALGAPLMELFYGRGSGLVIASLGATFLIEATRNVHAAKLRRELNFKSLAVRGSVAGVLAGLVAIAMALAGAGVWALVFQRFSYQSVMSVLTWRAARWRPQLIFDRAILAELMPFATRITITRGLEMLNSRLPDLLVGFLLGPMGVAFYRVGTRALDAMRRIVIQPFQEASFAALSRLRTEGAIVAAYSRLSRAVATATAPVFFGCAAVATELVVTLFGQKYAPSGIVFGSIALVGVANTLISSAGAAFLACGKPRLSTMTNLGLTAFNVLVMVPLVLWLGIFGAAVGSAVAIAATMPLAIYFLASGMRLEVRPFVSGVAPPILIAAIMGAVIYVTKITVLAAQSVPIRLALLIPLGCIIYGSLFAVWGRKHLRELTFDLLPILPGTIREWLKRRYPGLTVAPATSSNVAATLNDIAKPPTWNEDASVLGED